MEHGDDSIREADMRSIVRLMADTANISGGIYEKRRFILDGLCDLVGASEWRWTIFDGPPEISSVRQHSASHSRKDAIPLSSWLSDCLESKQPGGVGQSGLRFIVSSGLVSGDRCSLIGLRRSLDERPYNDREVVISNLILGSVPWLHWEENPTGNIQKKLAPRLREILSLLLVGMNRKDIAHRIGVTTGTVNGYISELYTFYGVNGHAELMKLRARSRTSSINDLM